MLALHLKITGIILLLLSLIHIGFPKYFQWKKELQPLSLINRQMMYVHTFFLAIAVGMIGLLCLCFTEDIIHTNLGKQLSLGLFIFWSIRLLFQFFVYSPSLWKGKLFETTIHIIFSLLWVYQSTVFLFVCLA
ncbi:hypothetical protein AAHN97_16340 [Chitinophaga niabensis]|uniref:hypothetical protein n=1 Tax=Chitinophaga niabensis TaxID=536979 RepID=UPI0031BBA460